MVKKIDCDLKQIKKLFDTFIVPTIHREIKYEVERFLKEKEPKVGKWEDITEEITFKVKSFKEAGGSFNVRDSGYYFIVGIHHGEECFRIDLNEGRLLEIDGRIRYKFYKLEQGSKGSFRIKALLND